MFPVQFITPELGPYLRRVQIAKLPFRLFFTNSILLVPKTQKEKFTQRIQSKKIFFVKFPAKGILALRHSLLQLLPLIVFRWFWQEISAIYMQNSAYFLSAYFSACYLSYVSTHCTFCVGKNCLQNKYATVFNPSLFINGLS
jgi:hypothetical protein